VQSTRDRDAAATTREEAKQLMEATQTKTNATQNEVKKLIPYPPWLQTHNQTHGYGIKRTTTTPPPPRRALCGWGFLCSHEEMFNKNVNCTYIIIKRTLKIAFLLNTTETKN
jgi:hypothetical protein